MTDALTEACRTLFHDLGDKVSFPGQPQYEGSRGSHYAAQQNDLKPCCILHPASTADVVSIVKKLSEARAGELPDLQCAVRSGGHATAVGSDNINGGVTLDLRSLNFITVAEDEKTVAIGPGATWGDVYHKLSPRDLMVVGGRLSSVGVGGLTLGGGLSFFSPRSGFVCDNAVNFEIVLADGRTVNASKDENPDLWWALRGGSNNFGIVTRLDFSAFPHKDMWGGMVNYDISTVHDQLHALHQFASSETYDEYSALIFNLGYVDWEGGMKMVNTSQEYTKPEAHPAVFAPFAKLEPQLQSTLRIGRLHEFSDEQAALTQPGARQLFQTTTIMNDLPTILAAHEAWEASLPAVKPLKGVTWILSFHPVPLATLAQSSVRGGNALGLGYGESCLIVLLVATWRDVADDGTVYEAAEKLFAEVDRVAEGNKAACPFRYLNYAAKGQRPFEGYGEVNRDRLREVARRFDPEGFFQNVVPGGFKLFG